MASPNDWQWFGDAAVAASRRETKCGVGKLITTMLAGEENGELPKGAADAVIKALANPDVTASGLITALKHRLGEHDGWPIPASQTIQRHRKQSCGCGLLEVHP